MLLTQQTTELIVTLAVWAKCYNYRVDQKTGLFLSVDNLATISGNKKAQLTQRERATAVHV